MSSAAVPAWKRLGLKLKASDSQTDSHAAAQQPGAAAAAAPPSSTLSSPAPRSAAASQDRVSATTKRKPSAAPALDHSVKRARRDDAGTPGTKTPKSVSFAAEPVELSSPAPATNGKKPPRKPKQKADAKKPVKALPTKQNSVNLQSALDYLRQWHAARDSWKFNKNHQTRLLEYVFADETTIPAVDINIFYEYIKPLKGYVRKRLQESAGDIRQKDMEQGADAFSSSSKDVAERKQKEYDEIIAGFLREGRTPEKRRFEEVEYVLRTTDMEMQRRVVKRMRAEVVLEELSESEESDTMSSSATATEQEPESTSSQAAGEPGPAADDGDKRVKLNDGTQRRIRRKKVRTAEIDDDSSSSSDDSDSDDDTSSSGSDSSSEDSDDEDAMEVDPARDEADTSSSSSSSSSGSDSEDDSSEEDDE
ncbi:hypothetical protein JX265_002780 [Neoarthrinium moseri]|uniref:WKF domain-containing protein n=1 Tax=Neoarthrinium moseri TaxID=1658444 RepID=A0A9Q0APM5_9PEZI|nr:hypothetical protein JX265_002780 [Neoarthrinium moseri]